MSDGYAAVIVGRSPHIVRCLTHWGSATAVTITGQAESGYIVAVAGATVGQRRTLREAVTLAARAHAGQSAGDGASGSQDAPSGRLTAAASKLVGSDAAGKFVGGLAQAAVGVALLAALMGGCLPIPGVTS